MSALPNRASAIIDAFGGTSATANVFGVSASAVSNWRKDGRIPARLHLRVLSEAARREVDVSAEDLMASPSPAPEAA